MRSNRTLRRWYTFINRKFFEGLCSKRVCIRWATQEDFQEDPGCGVKYFGWCRRLVNYPRYDFEIVLSRKRNDSRTQKVATIVHEMIHLASETVDAEEPHGPVFDAWIIKLTDRGIFRKGAILKDRTIF